MADLQGIKRNITEMALVCTEKQFANLCATDETMLAKEYVRNGYIYSYEDYLKQRHGF